MSIQNEIYVADIFYFIIYEYLKNYFVRIRLAHNIMFFAFVFNNPSFKVVYQSDICLREKSWRHEFTVHETLSVCSSLIITVVQVRYNFDFGYTFDISLEIPTIT